MNFNLRTTKIPVRAKCTGCSEETIQQYSITLGAGHLEPIKIAGGKKIAVCAVCSNEINTLEQEVTHLPNNKFRMTTTEEKVAYEQALLEERKDKWCVQFGAYNLNSQVINSTNEHAKGALSLTIWSGEDLHRREAKAFKCDVRQPSGEDNNYNEMPLEIELPEGLKGKVNYTEFRDAAEEYIKQQIGGGGIGINIDSKSKGTVLKNVRAFNNGPRKIYLIEKAANQQTAW